MAKYAVALIQANELVLDVVEAKSKFEAAFEVCKGLGAFDNCDDDSEDNREPDSWRDLEDFLSENGDEIEVKEVL